MSSRHVRKRKLIKPGLQLRMTGIFVGLVVLMLMLQFSLLTAELHHTANALPNDSAELLGETNRITTKLILYTALVFVPLTTMVGILATFRVAGPLFRIERFLRDVEAGEAPDDIRLRKHDELHDFARLLNDATRSQRAATSEGSALPAEAEDRVAA